MDRGAHLEVSPPVLLALSGASAPRPLGLHPGGAARSGHQGPGRSLGASDRRTLLVRCSKRRLAEGRAPSPESTITRSCRLLSRTQSPLDYQSGSNRSGHGAYTPHREHSRPPTTCGGVVRRQQMPLVSLHHLERHGHLDLPDSTSGFQGNCQGQRLKAQAWKSPTGQTPEVQLITLKRHFSSA